MSTDISYRDLAGRIPVSTATLRRVRREEELIVARAQLANEEDIAQAMVTQAAIGRFTGLAREVRQALDEDILNLEAVGLLLAYKDGAERRVRRLSQ